MKKTDYNEKSQKKTIKQVSEKLPRIALKKVTGKSPKKIQTGPKKVWQMVHYKIENINPLKTSARKANKKGKCKKSKNTLSRAVEIFQKDQFASRYALPIGA